MVINALQLNLSFINLFNIEKAEGNEHRNINDIRSFSDSDTYADNSIHNGFSSLNS
jgi:hypothetical protein